ncbi:GtrA family protein [Frisingicoccus sp.]|uniref:GtrA family protein n=1 Tax=Frisingicoccus sp. TaxID=1918627 RepID=UPI002E787C34|nr:GtrA family protein [Frisingicoccus sp.]MEE0752319.1 GtrA family protein [Frisingicoccus sp.]
MKALFMKYKEVISYLFFGVLTTVVNFVVYFACTDGLHINYLAATAVSWVAAVLFAYVTNRKWVFESKVRGFMPILREMAVFVGCRVFSGVMDMGIMFISVDMIGISDRIAKFITQVAVVVLNYIFSKIIIFRNK